MVYYPCNNYTVIDCGEIFYLFSGCVQGCIIPFMSKYKLSNSTPFGFGNDESIGICSPSTSVDYKKPNVNQNQITYIIVSYNNNYNHTFCSIQLTITDGYFLVNHLKNAGTPIVEVALRECLPSTGCTD